MATWHQSRNAAGQAALYRAPESGYKVVTDPRGEFASAIEFARKREALAFIKRTGAGFLIAAAPKPRAYMGCNINPAGRNSWGGRWESYVGGRFIAADTLAGIKAMIREALAGESGA
jgi:hypothetical protein